VSDERADLILNMLRAICGKQDQHDQKFLERSDTPRLEPQMRKSVKARTTIRANKRKAKLKAKHRRQRTRATA
jgi:hypothetical protein